MLEIIATPQFRKDLKKIPLDVIDYAEEIIEKLCRNPLDSTLDIKKLKRIKPPVWRVKIGKYRLIYSFTKTSLLLHRIRHRKDIYKKL